MASDLAWTIARAVGLTNSNKEKEVKTSINNQPRPSLTVSRKNLANFITDQLEMIGMCGRPLWHTNEPYIRPVRKKMIKITIQAHDFTGLFNFRSG